ncbi:MAG: glycerophosphodiester phosphodiesterase [Sarcina sp.]
MTLNLAHRGFSSKYPENTMLAFIKAKEEGFCDGIELDIQLSKDKIPVIIHDETLDRTTNGSGFVKDFTYKELRLLDAGKGEKIPSFEEFLIFAKEKNLYINLELKNSIIVYENLEEIVLNEIYKFDLSNRVILSSFNHLSMIKVKELDSKIKTGLLYDCWLNNPSDYAKSCNADALHPHYTSILQEEYLKEIEKNNILVNPYTIDDEKVMRKLIDFKVNSIITNKPDLLNKILNNQLSNN